MKRILILAVLSAIIVSCNLDGYTERTYSSFSGFEFDFVNFTDSLFMTSEFAGGAVTVNDISAVVNYDPYLQFNSKRTELGQPLTGGLLLTMKKDSSLVIKEDNNYPQYTMYATSAAGGSDVCVVYYQNEDSSLMPEHEITFTAGGDNDNNCTPYSMMINNTQLTVYNVLSDDSEYKFEPGDYLKLTVTGINNGLETGSVDYYLADYRGGGEKIDSVLTSWKTLSLSKLGDIDYVDFRLECSRESFPKTFCLDNYISSGYVKY